MRLLEKRYTENRTYIIFDVGANQGGYCSALLANIGIKDLQVWCFEPAPGTFKILQTNHGAKDNVFLYNIGFSNESGDIPLYHTGNQWDMASLFQPEPSHGGKGKGSDFELVTIKTIDDFISENSIPYIDLLKMDIEGNELNALRGAESAIESNKIKAIQFEFGVCNIDSRTFFRDFWNLLSPRYNIFRIVKNGLQPVTHYTEYDEVFSTINYYAELK
jgi:FkbM family methyltransferase